MVEIHWTNEAELWLKDIHDYIAQDKKSIAKKSCHGNLSKSSNITILSTDRL